MHEPPSLIHDLRCVYALDPTICRFIFPGVGLGAVLCEASVVSEGMLYAAALALSQSLTLDERARGQVFPDVDRIREVSTTVAAAVCRQAMEEGVAQKPVPVSVTSTAVTDKYVADALWGPRYMPYVHSTKSYKHSNKEGENLFQ